MSEQKQSVGETWFMKNSAPASPKFAHAGGGGKTHFPNEVSPFLSLSHARSHAPTRKFAAARRTDSCKQPEWEQSGWRGRTDKARAAEPDAITPSSWASARESTPEREAPLHTPLCIPNSKEKERHLAPPARLVRIYLTLCVQISPLFISLPPLITKRSREWVSESEEPRRCTHLHALCD